MEIRKLRAREEVVGAICDMCNKKCIPKNACEDDIDHYYCHEYGMLLANWGYWSDGKDLTREECHLCEVCFNKVRAFIVDQEGKVRKTEYSGFRPTCPVLGQVRDVDYIVVPEKENK